jgi:hypothetical protein
MIIQEGRHMMAEEEEDKKDKPASPEAETAAGGGNGASILKCLMIFDGSGKTEESRRGS